MPSLTDIENVVLRCIKDGNIECPSPDNISIGLLSLDYTACDTLSCIEHHALNCNDNEVIMGIFHKFTKELIFTKVEGVLADKERYPDKKISYNIESW
tara:strand:- start:236 stop:529 length:294 start_codon:yes stop_codon:yes gene_type:complete